MPKLALKLAYDYDVNAKLDAYRQSMKKKEEILSQLQQGVVNTQAEIHMLLEQYKH